ncbi:RING finger domain-containing protein [Endozoicomonas sp. ALC020]|uniref:RING finger domain-containing protein n=1 Tax=unclassified Endozoicomonas TaxID=2644528 RepID=UPI003BAFAE74
MLYLCKLVIFVLLISCGTSYGSEDNTYNDEYVNSDLTISHKDYEQSFLRDLLNLLTSLSLYYDEIRLPLRLVESTSASFLIYHLLKSGNVFRQELAFAFSISLISCFYFNFIYDLIAFFSSDENLPLAFCSLVARVTEHALSARITDYLAVKLFGGLCSICMDPIRSPIAAGECLKHFYCAACIHAWTTQSPLCPVCRQ